MDGKKAVKVLIIEDSQIDQKVLFSMLSSDKTEYIGDFKIVASLEDSLKALSQENFDIAILDLNLSDSHGEETLIKLNNRYPQLPIIVNTSTFEYELGVKTLSLGAQDFLTKGNYSAYILAKTIYYSIERKRLEQELIHTYQQLKETQSQLLQAEKMRVVGGLATGVAHEVKNPLATIHYGIAYLIEQLKTKDENVNTVLKNIKEAADRANVIITDMLDFASLTKLNKDMEDLNASVGKALNLIEHQLTKSNVEVVKDLALDLPLIEIDANKIQQVVLNLVLNAMYAMPRGGRIKIQTQRKRLSADLKEIPEGSREGLQPNQEVVILQIEDNGCGIPEENLKKVFEPFFTSRRSSGGVGLGLSVSLNIMEIHQGRIFLQNRKESGVCATLIFKT